MFGLGGWLVLFFLFSLFLLGFWLGLGLLLLRCGLFLGWHVLKGFVDELQLASNSSVAGLIPNGLVPAGDVGVLGAPLLVEEVLEAAGDDASGEDVGESQTLGDEICVSEQVFLKGVHRLKSSLLRLFDVLLVVWVAAENGSEPATKRREDLAVGERQPSQNRGVVLLGLPQERCLLVLRGHCRGQF